MDSIFKKLWEFNILPTLLLPLLKLYRNLWMYSINGILSHLRTDLSGFELMWVIIPFPPLRVVPRAELEPATFGLISSHSILIESLVCIHKLNSNGCSGWVFTITLFI